MAANLFLLMVALLLHTSFATEMLSLPSLEKCRLGVEFAPESLKLFTNLSARLEMIGSCTASDYDKVVARLEFHRDTLHPDTLDSQQFPAIHANRRIVSKVEEGREVRAVNKEINFDCANFVRPGYYRVALLTNDTSLQFSHSEWALLNVGNERGILHDNLPRLRLQNYSIFPRCNEAFNVLWYLPANCRSVYEKMDFRVRVLASTTHPPPADTHNLAPLQNLKPQDWIYLEEFPITTEADNGQIAIPCMQFDILHEQFCFELISVERETRHFERWARQCADTEPRRSSGETNWWSTWSHWSQCASRVCGRRAYSKRWRECRSKTRPDASCIGKAMELVLCNTTCQQSIQPRVVSAFNQSRNEHKHGCNCGCNLTKESTGQHLNSFFAGSSQCEGSSMVWVLSHHDGGYLGNLQPAALHLWNGITRVGDTLLVAIGGELALSWSRQQFGAEAELVVKSDAVSVESRAVVISIFKDGERRTTRAESGVYVTVEYRTDDPDMKQSEHIHPHSMTSFVHDSRLSASLGNLLYDCDGMGDGRTGNQVAVCEVIVSILVAFALLTTILAALLLPPLVLVYCTAMILPARRRKTALNLPTADHDTSSARGNARHGLSTTEQSSPTRSSNECMIRSVATAQTQMTALQISNPSQVLQRSIGIQLSRQSTPRLTRQSVCHSARTKRRRPAGNYCGNTSNTSLTSANTVDGEELEYDYSFLQPELAAEDSAELDPRA